MYKIKPSGNYNLLIADLKLTLLPGSEYVILTDSEFENSVSIKSLLNYLIIEKIDSTSEEVNNVVEEKNEIKEDKVTTNKTAFVARHEQKPVNEGVFVKDVELEMAIENDKKEIKEEVEIKTVEEKQVETVEVKEDEIVETVESQLEKTEPKVSKPKSDKKSEKPKTQKKPKATKEKTEQVKTKKISSKKNENKA